MAKVIGVDNLARDYNGGMNEEVAGENMSLDDAVALCDKLNAGSNDSTPVWYVVKKDSYQPYIFDGY